MKKILLGNEAIIKGALDAGVDFVSGYPGCPAAEIGEEFIKISKENGIYAEWSSNEKTALEAAIGASFSGLKSLVNMKSFGMNVCADSLLPLAYTGTKAPMVIVVADDPSCHSSAQTEQDSRGFAHLAHMPMLDPADPQECYDFTIIAFEISEKFKMPVILRITTRVAHQRSAVDFFEKGGHVRLLGEFVKNPDRFSTMPPKVLRMKGELLEKINKIKKFSEASKINKEEGRGKIGIIATGVSYLHAMEAIQEAEIDVKVLKLGFFYPLPEIRIGNFLKNLKEVLVVEETDDYLEKEIKIIAQKAGLKIKIHGKNLLPQTQELNAEKIISALAKIAEKRIIAKPGFKAEKIAARIPRLCEGCPYWLVFAAIKKAAPNAVFGGDIGCNMIAGLPPHNIQDYLFSMGSSVGISHGISKAVSEKQKIISIIGDGTFFHSGINGLINAVFNKSNQLVVVLDNGITAMTGHQQNPGNGPEGLKIEEIVRSCGVKNIIVLDPINPKELERAIKDFLEKKEVSVIICRRQCALLAKKNAK